MNKKQMVVLWMMVILISVAAAVDGKDESLIGLGVPVILIGTMLLFQVRDKGKKIIGSRMHQMLLGIIGLLVLQSVLMVGQGRELQRMKRYMSNVESATSQTEQNTSEIKSDVSTTESNTSDLR